MPFLHEPRPSDDQGALYEGDLREDGFVWDATRLWAHQPLLHERFMALARDTATAAGLTQREMAMLVLGTAATRRDSYCSIAWGRYLTEWAGGDIALAALEGDTAPLTERERALLA